MVTQRTNKVTVAAAKPASRVSTKLASSTPHRMARADRDRVDPSSQSAPLARSLPNLLRLTYRGFTRALERRLKGSNLTIGSWFFLRVLWEEDGLSQTELARRVCVTGPTTAMALNTLEGLGLIERRRNPQEKRIVNVFLTAEGRRTEGALMPLGEDVRHLGLRVLSPPEQEKLWSLLSRVKGSLDAADIAETGAMSAEFDDEVRASQGNRRQS